MECHSFTEILSPSTEEAHSMAEETVIELTEEQKKTRSKAAKIVDKLKTTEGAELKKVLFSLKTFFQEDKNLVNEFHKAGGLSQLVALGKEDEAQLQNFILRALGQIMLYVDGMQGVMEHSPAIELLYKLIASSNKLVVKTAIKLLLVNNEIGVIQPVEEIGKICRARKIFFHTDAAQAVGKIPVDVNKMNIDLMSISGHKIYGPKGVG